MPQSPDQGPEVLYAQAVQLLPLWLEGEESGEIIEMLRNKLVEAINELEPPSDDEEASEEQMRSVVLQLQATAFIAGMAFAGNREERPVPTEDKDEEELFIEVDSDTKLALTRRLLNGEGIGIRIT